MSAKSRLTTSKIAELQGALGQVNQNAHSGQFTTSLQTTKRNRHFSSGKPKHSSQTLHTFLARRLRSAYLLLIAIPGYLVVFNIVTNISPEKIAHWLVPYSYIPLQTAVLWGNFWALTWIFMNTGRGVRVSALLCVLLALKLQHVVLDWWILLSASIVFVCFEVGKLALNGRLRN